MTDGDPVSGLFDRRRGFEHFDLLGRRVHVPPRQRSVGANLPDDMDAVCRPDHHADPAGTREDVEVDRAVHAQRSIERSVDPEGLRLDFAPGAGHGHDGDQQEIQT